jgi:hypothetical protein
MRKLFKHGGIALVSILVGLPTGFVLGVLTAPCWGWFEASTGIESLGHSGPADWVYMLLGSVSSIAVFSILECMVRRDLAVASLDSASHCAREDMPSRKSNSGQSSSF